MKAIQFLIVAALATMSVYACSSNAASDKSGKEYIAAYICPMHCTGSGSETMGKCPVCKMDYVANKEHEIHATPPLQEGGHNHDHGHDHSGHNHSHDGHNHDGHNH